MIRTRFFNLKANSLWGRIFLFFVPLFTVTSFLIFGVIFVFIIQALTLQDHNDLEMKLSELEIIYDTGGITAVKEEIDFNRLLNRDRPFYVRIANRQNQTVLSSVPETWEGFRFKALENEAVEEFQSIYTISAPTKDFRIELMTRMLDSRYMVQVGGSTRVREEIFQHAVTLFFLIVIPTNIILIIWIGVFSSRLLKPINTMISFVKNIITSGDYSKTLPPQPSTGELEELTSLFNTMLDKADNLINRLRTVLDSLAHDIRTPVTKIRATAELALENPDDSYRCKEALAVCIEECCKLIQFTKSILELSEVEYGIIEIKKEYADIGAIVREVVEVYQYMAEDKHISITLAYPPTLFIAIDEIRLKQAISNILDNAVKYSPERTMISVTIEDSTDCIEINICDQGDGISEEQLRIIWDRNLSYDPKKEGEGLGVGLHISKVFIEAHGGEITIKTERGKGSCFTLRLPK